MQVVDNQSVSKNLQPQRAVAQTVQIPIISKQERAEVVSNFSIKSVQLKSELLKNYAEKNAINPENLPREPFSEESFFKVFTQYIEDLLTQGQRIQASYFQVANPVLKGTELHLEVANNIALKEILRQEEAFLGFLRKHLKNYDISLQVIENQELTKKMLITPEAKYNRLVELNPVMKDFKQVFQLSF